jgi:protein O-mannosyl-transferase
MHTRRTQYYVAAAVAAVSLALYLPALRNGFVIWDDSNIYDNIRIRSLDWAFFRWAFTDLSLAVYWQPLDWISHAIDYAVWGLNPPGHHLTSILLHAVNSFLVVLLVLRLMRAHGAHERFYQGGAGGIHYHDHTERTVLITAGATGLLFGIHPMRVEAVAWISERKELLYALFFMLSAMAYLDYAEEQGRRETRPASGASSSVRPYILSLVLFALSLAGKPMAVTLPAVLLLLDWFPLKRFRSRKAAVLLLVEKIPFILLSLIVSVMTILPQRDIGMIPTRENVPIITRILVACKALVLYVVKTLMPFDLSPLYPFPKHAEAFSLSIFPRLSSYSALPPPASILQKGVRSWRHSGVIISSRCFPCSALSRLVIIPWPTDSRICRVSGRSWRLALGRQRHGTR